MGPSDPDPRRTPDQPPDLALRLLEPGAFPRSGGARVELVETHVSWVFLVGERVYKVKKALDLGFLDARELETRRTLCAEELRLNAELAPGVHLGVVPIVVRAGRPVVDPPDLAPGEVALEWALAMRRLPAAHMLDALLERGELDNALLELLAERLARFHAAARSGPGVDEHGTPAAVRRNVLENVEQTRPFVGEPEPGRGGLTTLSPRLFEFLAAAQTTFLDSHAASFERRVAQGRVREGHGDLHASNICLEPDPRAAGGRRVTIFDRVEFAARLRCGDVAADLAFLAMDLDRRGYRAFAGYLARLYAERAGDGELPLLLPFYKTYRAWVRGKVGSLRAAQAPVGSPTRERERALASEHFLLAASYHLPPALILTAGLPASGKSTLARYLARSLGAALHASDETRKRLANLPATARARSADGPFSGLYGADVSDRTYGALRDAARSDLLSGRSVVIDAASPSRARRAPFRELARELGVPFVLALVSAPEEILDERFAARAADPNEVSDADAGVREAMRARFEPPDEFGDDERFEYRSDTPLERAAARLAELRIGAGRS